MQGKSKRGEDYNFTNKKCRSRGLNGNPWMKKFKSEGLNGNPWEKKYQSEGLNCIPWKKKFKSEGQDPDFLIKKYGSEGQNAFPGRRDSNPRGKSDGLAQPCRHPCRHLIGKGRLIAYPFVIVATSQNCGSQLHLTGNIQENLKHRRII
jgi:hypothetical protein